MIRTNDQGRHHRRSVRLKGYDYAQGGFYYVTLCVEHREVLFGDVEGGAIRLRAAGEIADTAWREIPHHFTHLTLDAFVVMPNHLHGILVLAGRSGWDRQDRNAGARHAVPLQPIAPVHRIGSAQFGRPVAGSIPTIVGAYKAAVTKQVNRLRGTLGAPVWQRGYWEHVIRNEDELTRIRQYIAENPLRWAVDEENPNREAVE